MKIEDEDVEKANDWLTDNADARARAKAERTYCEEYRKSLKAILFNEMEGTMAERENQAYAHERYQAHLEKLKQAVFEDEKLKALAAAAQMKIEVWRTMAANARGGI